ncbi:MAG: L,D-transpeptidase family protein [Phycisphaerales bacterium]|nr:L,D-transpeptidase family protein [Phycisphaerales bacterium]
MIGRRFVIASGLLAFAALLTLSRIDPARAWLMRAAGVRYSVQDRLSEFGPAVDARLAPRFAAAGVSFPPERAVFVAFKRERRLDVYAGTDGTMRLVGTYPILAASGGPGPKLREGDRQVPEGLYRIESLNPNSLYHLSLRLNYPSAEDLRCAQADGRDVRSLGGDIMIHGKAASVGCLAMGDQAAEDLFVLAARVGVERVRVMILPADLRDSRTVVETRATPHWIAERYTGLRMALSALTDGQLPADSE